MTSEQMKSFKAWIAWHEDFEFSWEDFHALIQPYEHDAWNALIDFYSEHGGSPFLPKVKSVEWDDKFEGPEPEEILAASGWRIVEVEVREAKEQA